jgi:hypothetical protein
VVFSDDEASLLFVSFTLVVRRAVATISNREDSFSACTILNIVRDRASASESPATFRKNLLTVKGGREEDD